MSNGRETAKLLPAAFRRQVLADNIVYKAIAQAGDVHMTILCVLYQNFIFSEGQPIDMTNPCLKCLARILDTFKALLPHLVTLEKESQLIDCL